MTKPLFILCVLCALCGSILSGCNGSNTAQTVSAPPAASNRVVLYCSVDDVYAKPIIKKLEAQTGLRIDVLYDTEAAKTAGLANRIRAERSRPRGDVFWSSALLQTLLLSREGLLQPYQSPSARDIPKQFKDPRGVWTGLGVRARVIIYRDTRSVTEKGMPYLLEDLLSPRFKNRVGISNPQFGTASDWAAALATRWGVPKTLNYFRALKKNGVRVLPGNSVVADKVYRGELLVGVTDTDDFYAVDRNDRRIGYYAGSPWDRPEINRVMIPGSVAMLKGAPHPEAARRLIDALLSAATERRLAGKMRGLTMLHGTVWLNRGADRYAFATVSKDPSQWTRDDTARWPAAWDKVREPLAEILLAD